jgi:putative membrane protein
MSETHEGRVTSASSADNISVELSSRRTGMSFQRTRLSADRTLMSVIRTSLSLIGFGFTIYQVFEKLLETGIVKSARAPGNFGRALVLLGLLMLGLGIAYHLRFMVGLRELRAQMREEGLIHGESNFPVSLTLLVAAALFALGLFAVVSMTFGVGPFH